MDYKKFLSIIVVFLIVAVCLYLIVFVLNFPLNLLLILGVVLVIIFYRFFHQIKDWMAPRRKRENPHFETFREIFSLISKIKSGKLEKINPEKTTDQHLHDIKSELRQIDKYIGNIKSELNKVKSEFNQIKNKQLQYFREEKSKTQNPSSLKKPDTLFSKESGSNYQTEIHGFTESYQEDPYPRFDVPELIDERDEFTNIYNSATDDRSVRQKLRDKYQTFLFGNRNAFAQAQGTATKAEFYSNNSGDFIAVQSSNGFEFLVVPQFDITINDTTFNEGGFGYVFDCIGYQEGGSYSDFQVVHPAIFEQKGDYWHFRKKGELKLSS